MWPFWPITSIYLWILWQEWLHGLSFPLYWEKKEGTSGHWDIKRRKLFVCCWRKDGQLGIALCSEGAANYCITETCLLDILQFTEQERADGNDTWREHKIKVQMNEKMKGGNETMMEEAGFFSISSQLLLLFCIYLISTQLSEHSLWTEKLKKEEKATTVNVYLVSLSRVIRKQQ